MERLKSITIIFLLAVGLLSSVAPAKPVSVLLQEGLYAEEIEGDLDAAIKIYEQVISESKKVKRAAAQATYRIGMCFLKKGEKTKAAEYFQQIVSNYQSQKTLVEKAEKQLDKIKPRPERIVEQGVMTISTCAEGDPRVAKALESLKGLDENVVVNELIKFLNSETNTVRRSAIYILWKGDLKDISAAVPTLEKLCSHKEDITRGMAAIALGAAKIYSSFGALSNMTLEDPSGYARRCAAYALGLMGNAEAKPILEKALKDSDPLVQNNAESALKMLEPPAVGGFGPAEPVPVEQLIKSGKVPAFKTQIYDNTGLDLETGVSVPFMDEWPALCDVAWDNDGGGALMIKPMSSVRFLALGAAENWEDAISTTRNSISVLRTSTSKGMFASQSKFVAVLTSEGNLAVIQIGEYDAEQATVYGWIEKIPAWVRGFGPVMERVINNDGEEKNWLIDFDTGMLFSHSTEIRSEEAFLRWCAENRIDAMGDTGTSSPGLYGFDMAVIPIDAEAWESISPKGLADDLSIAKGGTPASMSAVGKLPVTYIFKTREGGMGIVQILEMQHNKKPRHFRIRYKMLQGRAEKPAIANARSVAEAFLAAVVSGRDSEAIKLVKPGSAVVRQVKSFRQILDPEKLKIVSVYTDERIAVVTTTEISAAATTKETRVVDKGPLLIRLIKQRGMWMVEDVDLETPASLKAELDSFLKKHPNATKLQKDPFRDKMQQQKLPDIETLIKEMQEPEAQRFAALNKLIKIGAPAVKPLISELQKSNDWQVPKALGAIGDKRAVEPLIKKWQKCDWSPMKEVISEALEIITGKKLGQDKQKWDKWWQETKRFISPEATIHNFMAAAMKLDMNNAMVFVASDSHDYKDIKAIFEKTEHPFNMLFRKINPTVRNMEIKIIDNMCEAIWQVTFKEDFTIEGKTFKVGETFDIDGNLHKYGDKWLITGI